VSDALINWRTAGRCSVRLVRFVGRVERLGSGSVPVLRLSTVRPHGRLAHLPLDLVTDARGLGDSEVDLVEQISKACSLVVHVKGISKRPLKGILHAA
jgi:hypothetical protein